MSAYDINRDSTERIRLIFQHCDLEPNELKLKCDTFGSIKIVIGVIINFQWFLNIEGEEQDRSPQFVYTGKYF